MVLDPAWIALIGTLCGGLGLKLLEHWLGKSKVKIDEATKLRDELRVTINSQNTEIKELEAAVDKWRMDYFNLRDEYAQAKTEYMLELNNIKSELAVAKARMDALDAEPKK